MVKWAIFRYVSDVAFFIFSAYTWIFTLKSHVGLIPAFLLSILLFFVWWVIRWIASMGIAANTDPMDELVKKSADLKDTIDAARKQ